jgi:hypothetical protein
LCDCVPVFPCEMVSDVDVFSTFSHCWLFLQLDYQNLLALLVQDQVYRTNYSYVGWYVLHLIQHACMSLRFYAWG